MFVTTQVPNDCVVTAFANYTGRTYYEVHELLYKIRAPYEGNGRGYFKETWLFALACLLNREPKPATLFVHGILRFRNVMPSMGGHVVVIRADGTVVDGSLAQSDKYSLTRYLEVYPHLVVDEVWQ